ncbi:hypothetical protein BVX93_00545 [bacterium B13(2017)]|nr:hypothetical protein BVX93_00545 [bacterium B13(2017)]
MKFIDLIQKRQTLRHYSSKSISRELIDKCLEAARLAPSACNSQPWSFIIIDQENLKNELVEKAFSGIYSMNQFAKKAPVIIAVITERSRFAAKLGGTFRGVQYNLIDIGIACQHLVLQAEELDIGTCWLGWFNEKAVKKVLSLPKSTRIDILISMGYPETSIIKTKNRRPLNEIRKYNKGE